MIYFLLVLSILISTAKSVLFKKIGVSCSSVRQLCRLNSISYFCAAFVTITITGFRLKSFYEISAFSLLIAVLYAGCLILTNLTQIRAMALGSSSSTMLIYSCGFLIPIVWGYFFYNEAISIIQLLSVGLLIVALILIINPEKNAKLSVKWLVFSVLSMSGSGSVAICQKIHQRSAVAGEFTALLGWTFFIAGTVLLLFTLLLPQKDNSAKLSGHEIRAGLFSGVFSGILNLLGTHLAGKLPSVILFPSTNIGGIILTGIACAIIFREKLRRNEVIGFLVGCIAILFIGLF